MGSGSEETDIYMGITTVVSESPYRPNQTTVVSASGSVCFEPNDGEAEAKASGTTAREIGGFSSSEKTSERGI